MRTLYALLCLTLVLFATGKLPMQQHRPHLTAAPVVQAVMASAVTPAEAAVTTPAPEAAKPATDTKAADGKAADAKVAAMSATPAPAAAPVPQAPKLRTVTVRQCAVRGAFGGRNCTETVKILN
ncbi:hypothetical protein A33M_1423 [Rhodovulum sp. PH10]|uniref:hypothetical protein n=1 Tax=Rhodovulum sp. PH10 TaxID=1187851 RepID=UPI00027C2AE1|nr:hypothetical protein [Rhodovulum sp. PH10]EJW12861.1 hypothetical protein A33M_1423 [Rhodovulum sp. PH10]